MLPVPAELPTGAKIKSFLSRVAVGRGVFITATEWTPEQLCTHTAFKAEYEWTFLKANC